MSKKPSKFLTRQLKGAKDLAKDLIPRLSTLLDPQIWQSPESLKIGFISIATSFVGSRVSGILEEISSKEENINKVVFESEKSKQVLIDLVNFAAKENPDIEIWNAAQKIFIQTLLKGVKEQERASFYELINIVKEISGTEIRIIACAYNIFKTGKSVGPTGNTYYINAWAIDISNEIGLGTSEEVLRYEDNLVKQRLIVPRKFVQNGVGEYWVELEGTSGNRLTKLGLKLSRLLDEENK